MEFIYWARHSPTLRSEGLRVHDPAASSRMTDFSNYVVYVDESGDHSLVSVDAAYPVFVLAFCVFKKSDYAQMVLPAVTQLKFKHFGHDQVVLHEQRDIVISAA